ncbi:hypothetical protein RCH20_001037 [Psychrobacter sp. PL15]|nr:hypothetical protein [Psychrobacter sp. PL15]
MTVILPPKTLLLINNSFLPIASYLWPLFIGAVYDTFELSNFRTYKPAYSLLTANLVFTQHFWYHTPMKAIEFWLSFGVRERPHSIA